MFAWRMMTKDSRFSAMSGQDVLPAGVPGFPTRDGTSRTDGSD